MGVKRFLANSKLTADWVVGNDGNDYNFSQNKIHIFKVENVREGLEATLLENIKEDTAVDYLIFR